MIAIPILVLNSTTKLFVNYLHSNTNSDNAYGPDGIHSKILGNCAVGLAFPLSCIFMVSNNQYGYIFQEWKLGNVIPISKKGSKADVENCRPFH